MPARPKDREFVVTVREWSTVVVVVNIEGVDEPLALEVGVHADVIGGRELVARGTLTEGELGTIEERVGQQLVAAFNPPDAA